MKPSSVTGVLEEAEFYNITSLIKLIKDKIRERDCKTSQVCEAPICILQSSTLARNTVVVTITSHHNIFNWLLSSGPSQACVPGAAVPGGGADADGVHHVWRLEVRAGESAGGAHTAVFLLPCASLILLCFTLTQKVQSPIFGSGPTGVGVRGGGECWEAETTNPHLCHICIHDPGILSVLWLVFAACQYRLREGPPVRVSADCVKGGEGRGVCFAKQQRRGVSHKSLSTGWSLHDPRVVHTQPAGHCLSVVHSDFLDFLFSVFVVPFNLVFCVTFFFIFFLLLAHQWGSKVKMALFVCLWLYFMTLYLNVIVLLLCSAFVFGFDEAARCLWGTMLW